MAFLRAAQFSHLNIIIALTLRKLKPNNFDLGVIFKYEELFAILHVATSSVNKSPFNTPSVTKCIEFLASQFIKSYNVNKCDIDYAVMQSC